MMTKDELPKQITQTLYIALTPYDTLRLVDMDMTDCGWTMLGEAEVTADVPDADPVEQRIQGLEAYKQKEQAEYSKRIEGIEEELKSLRALTYNPAE